MEAFEYSAKKSVMVSARTQTIRIVNEDDLYREASAIHGSALERLVYAYEADAGTARVCRCAAIVEARSA